MWTFHSQFYYLVVRVIHAAGSAAASGRWNHGMREQLWAPAAGVKVSSQRSTKQGPKT